MSVPSTPATAGVLFPELADTSEAAPPVRSRGSRVLRMAARVVLWGLIAAGALRGLLPTAEHPDPTPTGHPADRRGEAVAAVFLREYLTVGDDRAERARRLSRLTLAGTELRGSVSVPAGVAQYVDHVVAAGSRSVAGGIEVTVLAHVLQVGSGAYRDGGTLAFIVPLAVLPGGVAVSGRPRLTVPPIAAGMSRPRPQRAPTALSRPAGRVARQAVAAFVAADGTTLARLGGGRPPPAEPLPAGWHAIEVGGAEVTGTREALAAQVAVRVRATDRPGQLRRPGSRRPGGRPQRVHRPPDQRGRPAMRPVDRDVLQRPAIGTAARRLETGHGSSTLRPGWYAYRATGTAELPSWAVEIALTIERPVASTVETPGGGPTGGGPTGGGPTGGGPTGSPTGGGPIGGLTSRGPTDRGPTGDGSEPTGAGGSPARMRWSERPLGPGSRGPWALPLQSWVDETLAPFAPEPEPRSWGRTAQAMVLVRAPGRLRWLDGIAEAIAEVETVAGVRPAELEDDLVEATGGRRGPRLRTGPVLPGLTPATAADAAAHLRIAGSRGLPAPLRRRRPAMGAVELAWRAGAGCVLTCDGPDGRSAQAVVGLRGMGNAVAIAPPPGGALVLRAWQARGGWGVACGLVLGAPAILGLGREARRVADVARSEGWDASVLSGSAAVQLARAGGPRRPAPRALAQAATRTQVAALFQACLTAGELAVRS